MKIFITGGSGNLGKELVALSEEQITAPSSKYFDLTNESLKLPTGLDLVIHCAAYTDVVRAEQDYQNCFKINVEGTKKLVQQVKLNSPQARFIHISTDYVFDGRIGNYKEQDKKSPINKYGLSKSLAEEQVLEAKLKNSLIIRTSFKPKAPWKYTKAFTDVLTSADYVDVIAPLILQAALDTSLTGTIHIGTNPKSIFQLAHRRNPNVLEMSTNDISVPIPKNPYLCLDKWNQKLWKK